MKNRIKNFEYASKYVYRQRRTEATQSRALGLSRHSPEQFRAN